MTSATPQPLKECLFLAFFKNALIGETMEHETNRIRCLGDDGTTVVVIEHQHIEQCHTDLGLRIYPGARRFALATGEPVRVIDDRLYEVIGTGELLRRLD